MSSHVIEVRGLGKRYRIGAPRLQPGTLRDAIASMAMAPIRNARRLRADDGANGAGASIWSLRDVSFEVREGEVLGLIGRNGAGKSTLLKVLSRITRPTVGRADVWGRVGSLLEVGTGFHPELTGRDNVFLNGAILGMDRAYIRRHFDEIVEFAGIPAFIDTPVKRYSSGMYLRLAFAVAAHLEPEVLIVDEVLAVGDAEFQRKCLSKMGDVARAGRTILFVSHNLNAVQRLCSRCMLLDAGRIVADGSTTGVINAYLATGAGEAPPVQWIDLEGATRTGSLAARFTRARYGSGNESLDSRPFTDGPLECVLVVDSDADRRAASIAVNVSDQHGTLLVNADSDALGRPVSLPRGESSWRIAMERLHLKPGVYVVGLWLANRGGDVLDRIDDAFRIEVLDGAPGERIGARIIPAYDGVVSCRFDVGEVA